MLISIAAAVKPGFSSVAYENLPGWRTQNHAAALSAFTHSCRKPFRPKGLLQKLVTAEQWKNVCKQAKKTKPTQAQAFFETYFRPYRLQQHEPGLITGYYIPLLEGALEPDAHYRWPVYQVPEDFDTPYLSRAEIEAGALQGRGLEIAWLSDPVMRFFLHIQGSGHVRLPDGRILTLRYAAKNGRPYTPIGTVLVKEGHLNKQALSLQTIRDYLYAHPQRQREIFNRNASYVFFSLDEAGAMPPGAQGVPLTSGHSLAIDRTYWPYGVPVYLDINHDAGIQRLVITQDTGSAIRGPARADLFVGLGDESEALAGRLAATAEWTVLLPAP